MVIGEVSHWGGEDYGLQRWRRSGGGVVDSDVVLLNRHDRRIGRGGVWRVLSGDGLVPLTASASHTRHLSVLPPRFDASGSGPHNFRCLTSNSDTSYSLDLRLSLLGSSTTCTTASTRTTPTHTTFTSHACSLLLTEQREYIERHNMSSQINGKCINIYIGFG